MSDMIFVVPICFWCGTKRNEAVQIEKKSIKIRNPNNKVHHALIDYLPCDKCKTEMVKGITVVEISMEPYLGQIPLHGKYYPTGKWCVTQRINLSSVVEAKTLDLVENTSKTLLMVAEEYRRCGFDLTSSKLN